MANNYFDKYSKEDAGNYFDKYKKTTSSSSDIFSGLDSPEYSAVRSGAVDFVESAIGAGDELDALVRLMGGQAQTWNDAITASRGELKAFQRDNPTASNILSGVGLVSGLFIPGAGVAKIAQTGSKLSRAAKVAGVGAGEGAVYGFLAGEGEDRATSAGVGALAGGILGGAAGGLLTKSH